MFSTFRRIWQFIAEVVVSSFVFQSLSLITASVVGGGLDEALAESNKAFLLQWSLGLCHLALVFPLWAGLIAVFLGSLRGLLGASAYLLLSDASLVLGLAAGRHPVSFQEAALELSLSALGVAVAILVGSLAIKHVAAKLEKTRGLLRVRQRLLIPAAFVLGLVYVFFWEVDVAGTMTEVYGTALLTGDQSMTDAFPAATTSGRILRNAIVEVFMAVTGRFGRTVFCGDPSVILGGIALLVWCLAFRRVLHDRFPQERFWSVPILGLLIFAAWALAGHNARIAPQFTTCGDFTLKDRAAASACMVALWRRQDPALLAAFAKSSTWRFFYLVLLTGGGAILLPASQVIGPSRPGKLWLDQHQEHKPQSQSLENS